MTKHTAILGGQGYFCRISVAGIAVDNGKEPQMGRLNLLHQSAFPIEEPLLMHCRTASPKGNGDERLQAACREWRSALGKDAVLSAAKAQDIYGANTLGAKRRIAAALLPKSATEVGALIEIAAKHNVPIYPVSTGKNWGYGCAVPVDDDCVVVHLSGMDRILDFDSELGLVTVEPGVTQQQLADYMETNNLRFLVPVTGAGPNASLLGNALERGYGITPHSDHFGALTALEAVLANGEIYRSALSDLGGKEVDKLFKWGLGPYLDGMFTQSNFGIVTSGTFALVPIPERVEAVFFSMRNEKDLEGAVTAVRDILRKSGGVTSMLNLMNTQRMLSMLAPYPKDQVARGAVMSEQTVSELARKNLLTAWTGAGCLYGDARKIRATRKLIRKALRPYVSRLTFLTARKIRLAQRVLSWLPFGKWTRLCNIVERLAAAVMNFSGRPSDIALPLSYWRGGERKPNQTMDPTRDGCGLIWYSPLVPMKSARVRAYVELVRRTCVEFGLEPLITLTSVSDRCFDSTVPLLFDRCDPEQTARAQACYEALFVRGQQEGFLPYRMSIELMNRVVGKDSAYWRLNGKLKRLFDPQGILAPGRYAPKV